MPTSSERELFGPRSETGKRDPSSDHPRITRRGFLKTGVAIFIGAVTATAARNKIEEDVASHLVSESGLGKVFGQIPGGEKVLEAIGGPAVENQRLKEELAAAKRKNSILEEELAKKEEELAKKEKENAASRSKIQTLSGENKQLERRTAAQEKEIEQLKEELEEQKKITSSLQEANSHLNQENAVLKKTVDALTTKGRKFLRKIFDKSPVDEILIPVLIILESYAGLREDIGLWLENKASDAREKVEKLTLFFKRIDKERAISDEILLAFGNAYNNLLLPVLNTLAGVASWLDENPLSQKALQAIEKSDWEPLKKLLALRGKFMDLKNFLLIEIPIKIEERKRLREEKISQLEEEIGKNPTNVLETIDGVIEFFKRITQKTAEIKAAIELLKDFIQRLREAEKEGSTLFDIGNMGKSMGTRAPN